MGQTVAVVDAGKLAAVSQPAVAVKATAAPAQADAITQGLNDIAK